MSSKRLGFLVGPARSGTSLLYKALCLHPDAAYISNYVRRAPALPELAVLNRITGHMPSTRTSAWFGDGTNAYVYGTKRSIARRIFPMPVEGEPVFTRLGIPIVPSAANQADEPNVKLRRAFARIQRAGGGSVLINKRIANNVRIPMLHATFPEARFVRIIRDGRAVALSLAEVDWWLNDPVWWYGSTPEQWAEQGGDPWEICARNWVEEINILERGLAQVPADMVMTLKYEAFVAEPLAQLQKVAAFIGLDASAEWEHRLTSIKFPNRNERWHTTFADADLHRIESTQGNLLRELGYECERI